MLRSIKEIIGYSVKAKDENVGKVVNFYFDDQKWKVRYLIVDMGTWMLGKEVLISPAGFYDKPDWKNKTFSVVFQNKEQVEQCPDVDTTKPVSRQKEIEYLSYFGWPEYWDLEGDYMLTPKTVPPKAMVKTKKEEEMRIRSIKEVLGYSIHAKDGRIGHIDDFIVDDKEWDIRFIVVSTRNIIPGKKVLVPVVFAEKILWEKGEIYFDLIKTAIENSQEYNSSALVNSEDEAKVYDYYRRPKK